MSIEENDFGLKKNEFHSKEQIERTLAHFIDPTNPSMGFERFSQSLLRTAITNGDADSQLLYEEMLGIVHELNSARLFNDTYIGHMLSEASIPGMVGYMMALRLGGNTVAREVSLRESALEPEAIGYLLDMVGYNPEIASGTFTSGGTMANFTALAVARKTHQYNTEMSRASLKLPLHVLTIPQAHYSIPKSIDLLAGPDRDIVVTHVPTCGMKMSPKALEQKILEIRDKGETVMAVVAIAGETETGLVDPLDEIAEIAQSYGVFSIADGAYGAPYRLSKASGRLYDALPQFNAISLDPHKALYTPYSNGAVLFKNAEQHVLLGMGVKAPYIGFDEDAEKMLANFLSGEGNHGQKRVEGSMGAGPIISTVAVMRTLGKEGLSTVYDITIERARHLYEKVLDSKWLAPMHQPDLNLLCFTLSPEAEQLLGITNNKVRKTLIEQIRHDLDNQIVGEGGHFFSSTDLPLDEIDTEGQQVTHYVWRACIMHPRTTNQIIDDAVFALETMIEARIGYYPE